MKTVKNNPGQCVRELRTAKNMTQNTLAKRLNRNAPKSRKYIYRIENSLTKIDQVLAKKLSKIFRVDSSVFAA